MDDAMLFNVIIVFAAIYVAVLIVQLVVQQVWPRLKARWMAYKQRKSDDKLFKDIDRLKVPADYSRTIKDAASRLNEVAMNSVAKYNGEQWVARERDLQVIRNSVAQIRYQGFLQGERDRDAGVPINQPSPPYEKGTGEAKQWARGWCMAYGRADVAEVLRNA